MDMGLIFALAGEVHPDTKAEIALKVEETYSTLEEHFKQNYVKPEILFDLKGTKAGIAYTWRNRSTQEITKQEIRLNAELLYRNKDDMLNQVLPHEIAHLVTRVLYTHAQPHGREWAYVMHVLGLPATRCHNYEVTKARKHVKPHKAQCACRVHPISNLIYKRMLQGQKRYCKLCRGPLTLSHPQT